mmetsp:Transcript_56610/g.132832  ORF Transcript_56610/g.132832 Transcript_56610/m.132832 type:complete len:1004 (-) Transcript_56610:124-3135(-)
MHCTLECLHLGLCIRLLLVALGGLPCVRCSGHPTSTLLAQARSCADSGRYLDFYSDIPGETLSCVASCPLGSAQVYSTCARREIYGRNQEMAITLHAICDSSCYWDSGLELAARLWIGLARALKLPLSETSASIMMADIHVRSWFTLEHFYLWRPGLDDSHMPEPSRGRYGDINNGEFDLFLAVRVHTSRVDFSDLALTGLMSGSASTVRSLVDHSLGIEVFQATRRSVDTQQVVSAEDSVPRFKFEGFGWNQSPVDSPATATTTRPATTTRGGTPSSPPTLAPAPAPQTCSWGCNYAMVGDGTCQYDCYTSACWWDHGDCTVDASTTRTTTTVTCPCLSTSLGDGRCDEDCYTPACNFDGGDCDDVPSAGRRRTSPTPPSTCGCSVYWLGDGYCDSFCNTEQCNYDHGDCDAINHVARTRSSTTQSSSSRSTRTTSSSSSSATTHTTSTTESSSPSLRGTSTEPAGQVTNVNIHVERHEELDPNTYRVLAEKDSERWYIDEDKSKEDKAPHPLESAIFIVAFFAALGLMTLLGVCLVAKGVAPGAEKKRRMKAMQAGEDPNDDWMAPNRPTRKTARMPTAWSSASQGQENVRDYMHWRTKHSYTRAAAAAMKEKMASHYAKEYTARSKSMPSEARSASKISVASGNSGESESTAAGSHTSPLSSNASTQFSHKPSDSQQSWFLGSKDRLREPKVHPEPRGEDRRSPARSASWKEPKEQPPPPPPPMASSPRAPPSGQRATLGVNSSSFQRSNGFEQMRGTRSAGSDTMRATQSEPVHQQRRTYPTGEMPVHNADSEHSRQAGQKQNGRPHPKANPPPVQPDQPTVTPRQPNSRNAKEAPSRRGLFSSFWSGSGAESQGTSKTTTTRNAAPAQQTKPPEPSSKASQPKTQAPSTAKESQQRTSPSNAPQAKPQPPKRSQTVPPSNKSGKWWSKAEDPESRSQSLITDMEKQLEKSKHEPLETRKRIFKDLQRQLHPDKNMDQPETAKLAFQKLMEQRATYLAG